jgi:transposase
VGPVTALATAVFLGGPMRFADGKAVVSYVGMIPSECSSGGQQRLGGLSKQGNRNMIHIRFPACQPRPPALFRGPSAFAALKTLRIIS